MSIATGSRRGLAYGPQAASGTPAVATTLLRNTGANFNLSSNALDSAELREDRQVAVTRTGNKSASGEVPVEFMFAEYDDLFAALLGSSWSATPFALKVGNTIPLFTFEDRFTDIGIYRLYQDCIISQMKITATPGDSGSYITGSFSVMGSGMTSSGSELAAPGAAGVNIPFDTCDAKLSVNIGGGLVQSTVINSFDLNITNNFANVFVLGNCNVAATTPGKFEVTGSLGVIMEDDSWLGHVNSEAELEMELVLTDPAGNSFTINLPRVRVTNPQTGTEQQAINQSMDLRALYDSTDATTITMKHS